MASDEAIKSAVSCACTVFIGLIIVLALSFKGVDVTEFGLKRSTFSESISDEVYDSGRYVTGPVYKFIKFSAAYENIEFSNDAGSSLPPLSTSTLEQQEIEISLSFQYKFRKEKIYTMYLSHLENYHTRIIDLARSVIKGVTSTLSFESFFNSRREVSRQILEALQAEFAKEDRLMPILVEQLQLGWVGIPQKTERAIIRKVVEVQNKETAMERKEPALYVENSRVMEIESLNTVERTLAEGEAEGRVLEARSRAAADSDFAMRTASAYRNFSSTIGLDTSDFLRMAWVRALGHLPNSTLMVAMENKFPSVKIM